MKNKRPPKLPPGCEIDYWDRLTEEERGFLKRFNDESVNCYFPKNRKQIHPKELRSQMDHARYARKRDVLSLPNLLPIYPSALVTNPKLEEAMDDLNEAVQLSDYLAKK